MTKEMKLINFEIDGKKVQATPNESILQVARRNGIYIPTMCYLTKVRPIASCRMCVVEVEGNDAPILSCQERAVEGLKVTTQSKELYEQRRNIMKLYDVNHPLQCGVCPKSGECDLQNKTLEFNVSNQDFAAVEQKREIENWGSINYDPYLCIMCERCVRVSNEIVGDEALQISPGGYNSKIINLKKDDLNVDWGECAAVCPVGALSDTSFKYSSNPWELSRIPASCAHTPLASPLYYEVKRDKIFRVRNESEFDSINGVCRYGYDFENRGSNSDEDMKKALVAFEKADTIKFNSMITNEEALILQKLKELKNYKLVNPEAYAFSNFLKAFSTTSGKSLYSGDSAKIAESDYIIVIGTKIADDTPIIKFKINQALKHNKAEVIYMHPIEDNSIQNIVTKYIKYEAGSEESVIALLASYILDKKLSKTLSNLDIGYISAESNVGEEEIEDLIRKMRRKSNLTIVVGSDLYNHPQAKNLAKILGLIEANSNFDVVIVPQYVNSLGVSLICDLDEEIGDYTIGYNEKGDFILSSIENLGDINLPALNQQEGTFTNLDKRVVPTHVALPFDGFCLNDIALHLGLSNRWTIDFTKELPAKAGFKKIEFDDIQDYFDLDGTPHRGYELSSKKIKSSTQIDELAELESFDGVITYICNPNYQKNIFTNLSKNLPRDNFLIGSSQFATSTKLKDGDEVEIDFGDIKVKRTFQLSDKLKGTISIMPIFDLGFDSSIFAKKYRFNKVKIKQVNS